MSSKVRKKQYMLLVHICGAYLFKCACLCTYSLSVSERMVFVALEDLWFQALLLLFLLVVSDAKRPAQYSEKGMKEKEKEKGEGGKKKKRERKETSEEKKTKARCGSSPSPPPPPTHTPTHTHPSSDCCSLQANRPGAGFHGLVSSPFALLCFAVLVGGWTLVFVWLSLQWVCKLQVQTGCNWQKCTQIRTNVVVVCEVVSLLWWCCAMGRRHRACRPGKSKNKRRRRRRRS